MPSPRQGRSGGHGRPGRHRTARARGAARRIDDRTLAWLADVPDGPVAPLLKGVARAADLLLPEAAIAAWWLRDGRPDLRRAALRGAGAVALAGVVEGLVLKPAVGRGRPALRRLPPGQRIRRQPSSSAFPSGHAGAATAFAVATAGDAPSWRPLLAGTAVLTGASLVHTGRHYPTDAVAGVLIGTAAGAAVRRVGRSGTAG